MEDKMKLTSGRYEVVKTVSERKSKGKYRNEMTIINIDSYERFKITFYTQDSGFNIIMSSEVVDYTTANNMFIPLTSKKSCRIEQVRELLQENESLVEITTLD